MTASTHQADTNKYLLYASEKFSNAVRNLAVGKGDVRSRLGAAFSQIHALQPEHLPEDLRDDFTWICRELTKRDPKEPGQGRLQATLLGMRRKTGQTIAQRIFDLHERIEAMLAAFRDPNKYDAGDRKKQGDQA